MASFGRTARQDAIWVRLNAIRDLYGENGIIEPEDEGGLDTDEYTTEEIAVLQAEYVALLAEYAAIHVANSTFG